MHSPDDCAMGPGHDIEQLIGRCQSCGEQLRELDLLLKAQEMRLLPKARAAEDRLKEAGLASPDAVQRAYDAMDVYERRLLEAEMGLGSDDPASGTTSPMRKRLQSMV